MKEEIIQQLPKIELHCHLDGSVRPHILEQIAQSQGTPLPYSGEELVSKLTAPEDCQSLLEYLERFDMVLPYLQTTYAIELISYDLIEQAADENVAYIEVRFAPLLFAQKRLSINQIVEAVIAGLKRGEKEFGVKTNALLCGMRHHSDTENQAVVEASKTYLNNGVVGFDIAGDEAQFPAELYTDLITLADSYDIPLTLHAGECGCPQNVLTSIKLGATRVGHGIAIAKNDTILAECKKHGTVIEMCPTSNFQTKAVTCLEDYPFQKFVDAGLNICINTDNRTVSNTTLTKEYTKLHDWYNITYDCMEKLNHNAVDGAFITDNEKEQLHTLLQTAYHEYK